MPETNGQNSAAMSTIAVIVSWNCRDHLARCLASLRAAGCPAVVVDNASTDGTLDMLRRDFPGIDLLALDTNRGFAAGTNAGIRHILETYPEASVRDILLLNPDTEFPSETLGALEAALAIDPHLGAVGPAIVNPDGSPQAYAFGSDPSVGYLFRRGFNRLLRNKPLHDWGDPRDLEPDWITGACILARADVFRRDGLFFDEGYFLYFEDNDWCLRLRRRGWTLRRIASARCVHVGGASLRANPAAAAAYRASLRRFHRLHYGIFSRATLALLLPLYAKLATRRAATP